MEISKYDLIGEELHTARLPNGLSICVIEKPEFSASFAAFATNYGGANRRFKLDNDWIDTPAGVAHFLEHKMFDMPDGDNALNILSANGADPNAFTSSGMTCYYFESTRQFEENLRMLLKFVSTPYFTSESVEKEQGIIGQEICMTEDTPGFAVYINLMKLLYANHPVRDAVAGSKESISEITPEILYSCHKAFYAPSNMALCVAGNVNAEHVYEIAADILCNEQQPVPITDFGPIEDLKPADTFCNVNMEVSAPQFLIGSKVIPETKGNSLLKQQLISQLSLRILVGSSSPFYTQLYSEGLLNRDFDYEVDFSANTATIIIGGESPEPLKVLDRLNSEVKRIKESGISKESFSQALRASFGARLRGLEDFDSVCVSLVSGVFGGYSSLDSFNMLRTITSDDCVEFISKYLSSDLLALSVISPEKV